MKSLKLFIALILIICVSGSILQAQQASNKMMAGKAFKHGDKITSTTAGYNAIYVWGQIIIEKLDMSKEGYETRPPVYNTFFTMTVGGTELRVQNDGNLVAYDANNVAVWASNTSGRGGSGTHLQIQIDGNLVLYNGTWTGLGDGDALWATGTCGGVVNGCGSVGTR